MGESENIVNIFINNEVVHTSFTNTQNQTELINKYIKEITNHENEN